MPSPNMCRHTSSSNKKKNIQKLIAFQKSHDLILEMSLVGTSQSSRNKTRICPPPEQEVVIFAMKTKVHLAYKAKVPFH